MAVAADQKDEVSCGAMGAAPSPAAQGSHDSRAEVRGDRTQEGKPAHALGQPMSWAGVVKAGAQGILRDKRHTSAGAAASGTSSVKGAASERSCKSRGPGGPSKSVVDTEDMPL